jgi:disulfide bond formation protein DsbB
MRPKNRGSASLYPHGIVLKGFCAFSTVTVLVSCYGFAMYLARTRSLFFLVFIACAMVIGTVVYLQRVFGLTPCVLCLWQRAAFAASGMIAAVAAFHAPGSVGCRIYAAMILLLTLLGAFVAGGQVWLQTATPDEAIAVMAFAEHVLAFFSRHDLVDGLHYHTVMCAEISWTLFGISLPEWSLLAFVALALSMSWPLLKSVRAAEPA